MAAAPLSISDRVPPVKPSQVSQTAVIKRERVDPEPLTLAKRPKVEPSKFKQMTLSFFAKTEKTHVKVEKIENHLEAIIPERSIGNSNDGGKNGPICEASRQRALKIVKDLKVWQQGLQFGSTKTVWFHDLVKELEYQDNMNNLGHNECNGENGKDNDETKLVSLSKITQNQQLPHFLQPVNVRVHVHEHLALLVGWSRISSRKDALDYANKMSKCQARAEQYIRFYIENCHIGQFEDCCTPTAEAIVLTASSNLNFSTSRLAGLQRLRSLLGSLQSGHKVAIVSSQTDRFCTNFLGLTAFMEPYLNKGIEINLVVYWIHQRVYFYDLRKLIAQYEKQKLGQPLDQHYAQFLMSLAKVARNKEGIAKGLRSNKQEERLGYRNGIIKEETEFEIYDDEDKPDGQFPCDACGRKLINQGSL
jgi:hypothetical protein